MSDEEIIGFWGKENLERWSDPRLADWHVPTESKLFLTRVGLPCRGDWTLRFTREPDQPHLPSIGAHHRLIGYDDIVPICLDERTGGRVVALEESVGGTERFINSRVEQFAQALVLYERYRKRVRGLAEHEAQDLIAKTSQQLRAVDPAAFSDPNNWWPVIIEQMRHGLL